MNILSFYLGLHDSNACLFSGATNEVQYFKSERMTGVKRHRADLKFIEDLCTHNQFDPDLVCYSDGGRNGLGACPPNAVIKELKLSERPTFRKARWYNVDHHMAHVLSAWPLADIGSVDIGVAIDGRGDHSRRISVFHKPAKLEPAIYTSTTHGVCHLFDEIGNKMGLAGHIADHAGKIMGAKAYGTVNHQYVDALLMSGCETDLPRVANGNERLFWPDARASWSLENAAFRDWLASVHDLLETIVQRVFKQHCLKDDQIAYSGGCALNSVFNQRLTANYPNLIIPPHCYDGGISIGLVKALLLELGGPEPKLPRFPFAQSDEDFGYADTSTVHDVANVLADGGIVGWLQGRGEVGPRSLGHRSILAHPGPSGTKDVLNSRIKRREAWRPYAPSILEEYERAFFPEGVVSPYMLTTVNIADHMRPLTGAVDHVDGTTRPQSVGVSVAPELHTYKQLLECFMDRTGLPALLTTSYNAGGRPVVANRSEALALFRERRLDMLVLGNEVFR